MRELTLAFNRGKKAGYLDIADALRGCIRTGQLRKGEALPSTRELARRLRVHRHTVMAAVGELVAEGWITAAVRRAYRVNETLPSKFFEAAAQGGAERARGVHRWRLVRSAGTGLTPPPASPARYAFKSGIADLRLFPHQEFKSCLNDSLKLSRLRVLDYGDPAGHPPLIEALKTYLRRVRAVSGKEIVITHGSQEGIFLAAQLLLKPGDAVAVESLGYSPAWDALKAAGAELVPVGVDSGGMDPDSLAKVLRGRRVRLIYTTPLHQYPTTTTLSIPRRMRLYELASRFGVPILEDDYDHEFHYRSQPLPPLASRDPEGLVIYVSTFSKVLFPSARIGFMAVPAELAAALAGYRRIVTRQNATLLQDTVARWMNSGGFERHLRKMRRAYEGRMETLVSCLEAGKASGLPLSWAAPDGGMAIWADTGLDSVRAAELALRRGVYVHPGANYRLDRKPDTHLRLGFANQSPGEIEQGATLLFDALRSKTKT